MNNRVKFTRKINEIGGSIAITIPKELAEYLNVDVGDEIEIMDDFGKHGRFISFWKKNNIPQENEGGKKNE